VYTAVDDHEFEDNWPGRADRLARSGDALAREYMKRFRYARAAARAMLYSMTPQGAGRRRLWYRYTSGGLPFFVMDTRTERKLRAADIAPGQATIVAARQMRALKSWLATAPANQPKFIVSGSVFAPVAKCYAEQRALWRDGEGWAGYPASWRELTQFIVERQIENVVFLSGDYHLSAMANLTLQSKGRSVQALSIVSSALYAPLPFANESADQYAWDVPVELPFGDADASVTVEARLLSAAPSQFLRIDVEMAPDQPPAPPRLAVTVYGPDGPLAPAQPRDGTTQLEIRTRPVQAEASTR
jgi:phosphodiesterase/alkaline phosphatase D-like protein